MTADETRPGVASASPGAEYADQSRAPYFEALERWVALDPSRFSTPGHKGGEGADPALRSALGIGALRLDIPRDTEGIDIGPPPTPFDEAEILAADAYGAARAMFLGNGATQGNHALCLALAPHGERILVQRNSHASLIDGLVLSGGIPSFVSPEYDAELGMAHAVTPQSLAAALARTPRARAAFIVSPTYFGMAADIAACAEVAHDAGIPLVVDGAWGAHFGFHPDLPRSPLSLGADAMIASTHKMVGSLGQSAMLLVSDSGRVDVGAVARAVRLLRTTSPSSLLFASLDAARRLLVIDGESLISGTIEGAARAREEIARIPGYRLVDERFVGRSGIVGFDPLKVVVDVRGIGRTGYEVASELMHRHDTHIELATHSVILVLLGIDQPLVPLERLPASLAEIASRIGHDVETLPISRPMVDLTLDPAVSPRDAFLGHGEAVAVDDAIGRISCEAIAVYPPGVPTFLPGERVTAEIVAYLRENIAAGATLHGAADPTFATVRVLAR
jgi:arginine/lysine/ornithine decarboxylase